MKGWRWLLLLLLCSLGWQMECGIVNAAGASISIKPDVNPVVKGEIFYVMITVTSTEEMSGFEGYFSYDQGVMKYMTGGSVSSGNDDVFSISDTNREKGTTTLKYSIQFKARRSGYSTVELKQPYRVYNAETSEKMSVAYDSVNIRVLSKKEAREQQEDIPNQTDAPFAGENPDGQENEPSREDGENSEPPAEEKSTEQTKQTEEPQRTPIERNSGEALLQQERQTLLPQQTGSAVGENQESSSGIGLGRGICIAVIVIASINLVLLGIAFVRMRWRGSDSDFDDMSAEASDEIEEQEIQDMQSHDSDIPDSLEDIERRLERKRQWLREDED